MALGLARAGYRPGRPKAEVPALGTITDNFGRDLLAYAVEQIKNVSANGDLDEGIEAEKGGFVTAFSSEDAREGISAFLGKRKPKWQGK